MREIKEGTIVKVSPFIEVKQWADDGSHPFSGEAKVTQLDLMGKIKWYKVEGSNWWRGEYLLVKGVDYE